jgi:catechol 2,3-dioxygenase-like lactoylglutathione lyase family enzyme
MKLNHVNLTVTDVRAAGAFLEKYFGLRPMGGNDGMAFLFDDEDLVLTLMRGSETAINYPSTFHVGFFIDSEARVDEIYRRLREDGYDAPPPERHNHGYGFYVEAPGGFTIELGA